MYKRILLLLILCVTLSGCDTEEKEYTERSVDVLFQDGHKNFTAEKYQDAADNFDEVERQHPYSSWAGKAQIMSAYSSYKAQKFQRAITTLDVFITIHPSHSLVAYSYYLRSLCYYTDMQSVTYDKSNAEDALQAFQEVVKRFPGTDYSEDSKFKIAYIKEYLASNEMITARTYLRGRNYLSAQMRFCHILEEYPNSVFIEEALYRMVECQIGMGFIGGSKKSLAVLHYNFPNGKWYKKAVSLLNTMKML